jgi:hypothetical protein
MPPLHFHQQHQILLKRKGQLDVGQAKGVHRIVLDKLPDLVKLQCGFAIVQPTVIKVRRFSLVERLCLLDGRLAEMIPEFFVERLTSCYDMRR